MEPAKLETAMRDNGSICLRLSVLLIALLTIVAYTSVPRMLMSQEVADTTETSAEEAAPAENTSGASMGSVQKMGPVTSCGYNIREDETNTEGNADGDVDAVQEDASAEAASDEATSGDQASSKCSGVKAQEDPDGDAVTNCHDNCPSDYNPDQADGNDDGFGDVCEAEKQKMCNRGALSDDQCQ